MRKPEKQQKQPVSKIDKFFCDCAGADIETLSQLDCQTDIKKQAAIGRIVLLTASTATLSGTFAFYTIFLSTPIAIALGFYWGLIIFNLDRFFILSAKKKKNNNFFGQFKVVLPRLALAGILAVGITKPLELKIFDFTIKKEIFTEKKANLQSEIKATQQEIEGRKNELKSKQAKWNEQLTSVYQSKRNVAQITQSEIDDIRAKIERNEEELQQNKNRLNNYKVGHIGLTEQLAILEKLAKKDQIIGGMNFFFILLFAILEIAPLMVKLMSEYSTYDAAIEAQEGKAIHYHTQKLADAKKDIDEQIDNQRQIREAVRANTRQRIEEFLTHQFTVVLDETTQSDDLAEIRKKIVKLIATNIEEEMMKQFSQIKMNGVEIEEQLNQIKGNIFSHKLRNKVSHVVTEAEVERLFQELEQLKEIGNSNESN